MIITLIFYAKYWAYMLCLKGIFCEVPFLVDRLFSYFTIILIKQTVKEIASIDLNECNGKLMEDHKTLKTCGEILISHPK